MRTTARNLTLALSMVTLAACGGGDSGGDASSGGDTGSSAGGEMKVTLTDFAIDAPSSVPSGTTLTVVNEGSAPHTFTGQEGAEFDTGTLDGGAEASVTVDGSGTVSYVCTIHPDRMQGSFEVTDA